MYSDTQWQHLLAKYDLTLEDFLLHEETTNLIEIGVERIIKSPYNLDFTYIGHSGGKDSCLVHFLAEQAMPRLRRFFLPVYHNCKPGQIHPKTIVFLYDKVKPDFLYGRDIKDNVQIDGTRRSEATRTDGRSTDVIVNGVSQNRIIMNSPYLNNGLFGKDFIYPIYDWSDLQVWSVIRNHEIAISEEYFE